MRGAGPGQGLAENSLPYPKALPLTASQALMAWPTGPELGGALSGSPSSSCCCPLTSSL